LSTVRATRAASEDALVELSEPRLLSLLHEGVTTVEIKSGYGLSWTPRRACCASPAGCGSTPCDRFDQLSRAHALPPEFAGRADDYIDTIASEWLPRLAAAALVDTVDAYCEDIAFSAAVRSPVHRGHGARLPVRLHAEQLSNLGGTQVATRHARCRAITSSTRMRRTPQHSLAPARWP